MKTARRAHAVRAFALFALLIFTLAQGCARKPSGEITLPQGKTAEVVFVAGDVFVSSGGDDWVKAQVGDVLGEGSRIRTEGDSYCEITLSSGIIFRMKDRSELLLVLLPAERRQNKSTIRIEAGSIFAKTGKLAYRSEQTLATPTTTLAVRGTGFLVETGRHPVTPQSPAADAGPPETTSVMVADGVVRARLNVDAASLQKAFGAAAPGTAKTARELIERGVRVKGGHRLEVTAGQYETVVNGLREAAEARGLDESGLEALKRDAVLLVEKLTPEDLQKLKELDSLTLSFRRGDTLRVSPNFDGVNDEFVLDNAGYDFDAAGGWRLVVTDGGARIVKTIEGDGAILKRLPPKIVWNCTGDNGLTLPDGEYVYELYTLQRGGRASLRVRGVLEVDTLPPEVAISPQEMTFSPNGDGLKDVIAFTVQTERDAGWSCAVTSSEGAVVKRVDWGFDAPVVFEWDGKDESGSVLPDGLYDFSVTGTDGAGNKVVSTVREIAIDTRSRGCTVVVDRGVFSPNGDGVSDMVTFVPFLTDPDRVDTWDLVVQNEKGETVRRFRGQGTPPLRVPWDGSPEKGKGFEYLPRELPSGTYSFFLKIVYKSGVNTFSYKKALLLDRDPPRIALSVSPELFSPDGDGENDTLLVVPTIEDLTPITAWKAVITTSGGSVFKIFSGSGQPAGAVPWDGVSDRGIRVSSAEDFSVQVDATDSGSNTGKSEKVPFSVDILVIPTDRGLKIQVSNIEFAFDTADLKGDRTFVVLERVVGVLRKYGKYTITIEGHTDSRGDPAYNVALSKKRAQAVGKYLVKNGISQDRLSYEGYGPKFPIDTNETPEGRARNRRVEFLLQKR